MTIALNLIFHLRKMLRCLFFLVEKMYSVWSLSSEDLFAGNLANNDMGLKSR